MGVPRSSNTQDEASAAAIGVDPMTEIRRILSQRPGAIVDDYPRFAFGNRATRAVLREALARDYHLAACIPTGPNRCGWSIARAGPVPAGCPSAARWIANPPRAREDRNVYDLDSMRGFGHYAAMIPLILLAAQLASETVHSRATPSSRTGAPIPPTLRPWSMAIRCGSWRGATRRRTGSTTSS